MKRWAIPMLMSVAAVSASAQAVVPEGSDPEAFRIATEQVACGDLGILSAVYNDAGEIAVDCDDDVTGFVPLLGGLAPALGGVAAVAALAGAGGGGGAPSDTQ